MARPSMVDVSMPCSMTCSCRPDRPHTLTRRAFLTTSGAGLTGLAVWAVVRAPKAPGTGAEQDGPVLEAGSTHPGRERWRLTGRDDRAGDVTSALLAGGTVLVHGARPGPAATQGLVRAVGAEGGASLWQDDKAPARAAHDSLWGVASGLLIAPELLDRVHDVRTGDPRLPQQPWRGTVKWFAVADGRLVTLGDDGGSTDDRVLRSLALPSGGSRATGGPRTHEREKTRDWRAPAVSGTRLLLVPDTGALDPRVFCLDVATGREWWSYPGLGKTGQSQAAPVTPPAPDGRGGERFALLSDAEELHLIDVRTGDRLRNGPLSLTAGNGATALGHAAGTGLLVAAGEDLIGFSPDSGKRLWSHPTAGLDTGWPSLPGGGRRGPVARDGVLLSWLDARTLQALDLADGGRQLWRTSFDAIARCPPAI
ncbi:outer membrane protein assembly factor BamB family protein [Streptomyces sp. PBSH9]|uniref:outer membrane protein assembly factor BamB family protein n=1 Tax=Streptomyces sp. PBSH9 TaxID=2921353 RepID=UPI0027E4C634|nr:PQQ-binding-like beta-propeller repeat protein [Streptomyces sp. PBSH9]